MPSLVHFPLALGIFNVIVNEVVDEVTVMKSITIVLLALAACLTFAAQVSADTWLSQLSGEPEVVSGVTRTIKGTITGRTETSIAGACAQGYSAQCPMGHTCTCTLVSGARFTSTLIGKGTANVFITVDASAGFGLPTPTAQPTPECFPYYLDVEVIARNDTESLSATGAICSSRSNSSIGGSFAIAASSKLFSAGYATFSGALNTPGPFRIDFKGQAVTK